MSVLVIRIIPRYLLTYLDKVFQTKHGVFLSAANVGALLNCHVLFPCPFADQSTTIARLCIAAAGAESGKVDSAISPSARVDIEPVSSSTRLSGISSTWETTFPDHS